MVRRSTVPAVATPRDFDLKSTSILIRQAEFRTRSIDGNGRVTATAGGATRGVLTNISPLPTLTGPPTRPNLSPISQARPGDVRRVPYEISKTRPN